MIIDEKIDSIKQWLGTGAINIFGLPYAGKDTHGKFLAETLGANLLGGGEILRNSEIPPHAKEILDAGQLIPTEDYVNIVLPYLSNQNLRDKPLILSSVGRWHGEEDGVMDAAEKSHHPIKAVIYLHITIETANERFKSALETGVRGHRADDDQDKLIVRFSEFTEKTLPVIDYYREKNLLIEIDGNPSIDDVRTKIIDELYNLATNQNA